jgi:hypothetical protein
MPVLLKRKVALLPRACIDGHPVVLRGKQSVCVCASDMGTRAASAAMAERVKDFMLPNRGRTIEMALVAMCMYS